MTAPAATPTVLDVLVLRAGDRAWLAPAGLVVEVVPHFADAAPATIRWHGTELPCLDDGGAVRALVVLRRLGGGEGFYALAVREPPAVERLQAAALAALAPDAVPVGGITCTVFRPAHFESRLPAG